MAQTGYTPPEELTIMKALFGAACDVMAKSEGEKQDTQIWKLAGFIGKALVNGRPDILSWMKLKITYLRREESISESNQQKLRIYNEVLTGALHEFDAMRAAALSD